MVRQGDVIVSTVRTYLKAIAHISDQYTGVVVSTGFAVLRPFGLFDRFLAYVLTCEGMIAEVIARSVGVSYPAINSSDLLRIKVPVPPHGEQQAIAAFLDRETAKIDALVAEQERLLVLLEEKRQAAIANAVTKGLDPAVPMKDSGVEWLEQVPAHWSLQPVRWLSTFVTSGPRGWSDHIDIEGSLFIQSGDLTEDATIEFSAAKRVKVKDDAETARTSLQEGDVVVCITGAKTGKVAVCTRLPETAYVNQHLCLIRPKQDVVPTFLGYALKSRVGREHFQSTQYGLKQGLSLDDIKTAVIPLPPRAEQKHILGHLSAQERVYRGLSEEAQQLARLLGERRAALISAAVTGKIDVRGLAPAVESALAAE